MTSPRRFPSLARLDAAIADLARLRSDDPAAQPAIQAVKLAEFTLESVRCHADGDDRDPSRTHPA